MLVLWLSTVLAANTYLDEGRRHFSALEFDGAARTLAVAVEQPGLTVDERREAFHLWAQSLLAIDQRDLAEQVYVRLLKDDPYAPRPEAAPKVVDTFLRAKQQAWPRPSVTLQQAPAASDQEAQVAVFDPWNLVQRVRWFDGTREQPSVPQVDHHVTVTPGPQATRLLFDALDASGVLLAHLEVTRSPVPARADRTGVLIALGTSAAVAVIVGAVFLGLAFQAPPTLTRATDINAWNGHTQRDAALGWSLGALGLALGATGGFVAAF